ncbi:MAG: hypothetical protein HQK55_07520 [Deltaproteobacteria bacterium]|nr:hypothetical protein [Deltaproteobacteria bacterium]
MSTSSTISGFGFTQTSTTTSTSSTTSSNSLNSTDFMTLFLKQLQNQDPTNPTDTNELTSQLCSYSQLEELSSMNNYLSTLTTYQKGLYNSQATQTIGKTVVAEGNSIEKYNGTASGVILDLDQAYSSLSVSVYDKDGSLVKTMDLTDLTKGENDVQWDGTDNNGNQAADGNYTFKISSNDSDYDSSKVTSYSEYYIKAALSKSDGMYLRSQGGQEILYSDVTQVMEA